MDNLKDSIKKLQRKNNDRDLILFDLSKEDDKNELVRLIENGDIRYVIDNFGEQIGELKLINDPSLILNKKENSSVKDDDGDFSDGKWIFLPWRQTLIHSLDKEDYEKVRLSRNSGFISDEEQKKIREYKIGVVGLNVGNSGTVCMAQGGFCNFKLADLDILSLSNLNRFRASLAEVEVDKTTITARQIYEINPYANLEIYDQGIQPENISKFLLEPKIDLLIEEMDNLKLKIVIRELAKKNKIPVLMVTGNGSNIVIDVERYDLDNSTPILNGYLKEDIVDRINKVIPTTEFREKMSLARDFMGGEYLVKELRESFDRVGVDLAGIPQLAEATFIRGAALSYFARKILSGEMKSGRYNFGLDIFKNL